jgi:hypothetical protein
MRNPARAESDFAGTDLELVVAHLDDVFSLEHVPQLVLVPMYVDWRIKGIDLFDQGERSASGIGGSSDDELGIAPRARSSGPTRAARRRLDAVRGVFRARG